jgi:hypothetical protein
MAICESTGILCGGVIVALIVAASKDFFPFAPLSPSADRAEQAYVCLDRAPRTKSPRHVHGAPRTYMRD